MFENAELLHLVKPTRIFIPTHMVRNSVLGKLRMCRQNTKKATSGRDGGASHQTMSAEISDRGSLLRAGFQIPVARQGGREMSAPRPYLTDPFHSLSSIPRRLQFLDICHSVLAISSIWYLQVCRGMKQIWQLRMRYSRNTNLFTSTRYVLVHTGTK